MKEMCPNCKSNFAAKDINNINKNSIFIEKQCPSCQTWFCLNKTLTIIKIIGIFLLLITSLLNIFNIKSQYSLIFSSAGFVGILVAIIITFFGQNEAIKK